VDYLKIANGFPMWIAAIVPVSTVLILAFIFFRKSCKTAKAVGITDSQIKTAIRSSFISAIGPSIVIVVGMLSLLVSMGGPISLLRLSFIGSLPFELMAASIGTEQLGIKLGSAEMNGLAFSLAVWTMILSSIGWLINVAFFAPKLDKMKKALSSGRKELFPIISIAAMLGAIGYVSATRILPMDAGTVALFAGAVIMGVLTLVADKKGIKWLNEWALSIAMFSGMAVAVLL